jgi:hypothetical protein
MNLKHFVTVVLGLGLALSFIGCEWTWDYSGGWWFWLRGASRVLPSIALLACGLLTGTFIPRSGKAFLFAFAALIPLGIYCVHIVNIGSEVATVEFRETALTMVQAALCGIVGYWVGKDGFEVRWLLSRAAAFLAVAAWLDILVKISGLANEFDILRPGWPAYIVIVFGYCWYLNDFLTKDRINLWSVIAMGGCGLSILAEFHKPIIFITVVCSLILFFVAARSGGFIRVVFRMTAVALIGIVGFFAADQLVGRRISSRIMDIVESKFLHQDVDKLGTAQTFWEKIEQASGNRINIWTQALEQFAESPVFGHGPGQVKYSTGAKDLVRMEGVVLHEVYLEFLLAVGLAGAAPLLLCVVWWFRLMLRKVVLKRVGFYLAPCTAYVTCILALYTVSSAGTFFTVNSLLLFLMGSTARIAEQARQSATAPNPFATGATPQSAYVVRSRLGYRLGKGKTT